MNLYQFFSFSALAHNERKQADAALCGRSMVEMLGVLAIIGVLSVGAIAGYSKAMLKYKLNKQAEQISTILNNALVYVGEFTSNDQIHVSLLPMMIKLNNIPKEMIAGTENYPLLYDALHNQITLGWGKGTDSSYSLYNLVIDMTETDYGMESCRNIINTVKENHADLWQINIRRDKSGSSEAPITGRTYGDGYCHSGSASYPCIRDMTMQDIQDFCEECSQGENKEWTCRIEVMYGYVSY